MKPWNEALKAYYRRSTTHLAVFWWVVRLDGEPFGWVEHDRDLVIDGLTYRASAGLRASAAQATADLQPGTLDVSAFLDVSSEAEIEAGVWDEARITVFETRWDALPATVDPAVCNIVLHGRLGKIDRQTGTFQAQLHGLLEQLDTQIGRVYGPSCPWRLGDSRCQVDLGPWTRTGIVTSLGDDARYTFLDATQGEEDGWFNEGAMTITSGTNAGRHVDVRQWEAHTFTLHRPLPVPLVVGDTYSAIRGDDKTFQTCDGVFDNHERFGGFPFLPGIDAVMHNNLTKPLT